MKVSDVGETGLLQRIADRVPALGDPEVGSGDDAAVLDPLAPRTLVSTDMLVEGIDFDLSYCSGSDVGWRSVAVNLSDIAAMGGKPRDVVVSVGLPADLPLTVFDLLLDGMLDACGRFGVRLVGGDISEASELGVAVTVLGSCERPVLRSGARPGDALCVTGSLGGAAAGLFLLQRGTPDRSPELVNRHLRPVPRIAEGTLLASLGATAMIDLSDGLGIDALRLMSASGAGCVIDPDAVPIARGVIDVVDDPVALAVGGGEDFELLVTLPDEVVDRAVEASMAEGTALTRIGEVTGSGVASFGTTRLEEMDLGWVHLRNR